MTTTLTYTGQLAPGIALVIAAVASAVVFLIYRMETKSLGPVAGWLLPTLRSTAVLLMIFLLAGPVLETARRTGTLGQVTFLLDCSDSMNYVDRMLASERIGRAKRMLEGENGLIASLRDTHDVSVLESPAKATATNLAQLISEGFKSEPATASDETTARSLVLISDGQNNVGDSPIELANEVNVAGVTLSTWGFGLEDESEDFAIIEVQQPDRINSTSRLRGKIVYQPTSDSSSKKIVIRESGGQVLWQETLEANESLDGEIEFDFAVEDLVEQLAADKNGQKQDVVRLNLLAELESTEVGEQRPANRSRQFSLLVTRANHKMLILDGRSRWETRYLKNLFGRDPQWETDTVILFANDSSRHAAAELPSSLESMLAYDLIFLGEVQPESLDVRILEWLPEYVARGGGLILVDGQRDWLSKTIGKESMELVPVRWLGGPTPFFADRLIPTAVGEATPWLSIGETAEQNRQLWRKLPAPRSMRLVEPAKDAETLVEVDLGGQRQPMIVTRSFGGGRIVYLASDETWRWRYKVADEIHGKFWNQLALALLQPPLAIGNDFAQLDVEKAEYVTGERATVRVRLRNPDGSYNNDGNVEAQLLRDGEQVESFLLRSDERLTGMYVGQSMPLAPGEYSVRFSAAGYGDTAAELACSFSVVEPVSRETLRVSQNRELLEKLAVAGGGQYFSEDEVDSLRDFLLPRTAGRIDVTRVSLWDSYYWFLPVICLLAVEWWLRKRLGLP